MPITTPAQLVDEFKKSGEFDRLRREILKEFQRSDGAATLKEKVEGIARQWLDSEQSLQYMSQERVHRALMQEVDRYPIVERAAADMHLLTDESFTSAVRRSVQKILREDRGEKVEPELPQPEVQEPHKAKATGDTDTPKLAPTDVNESNTDAQTEKGPLGSGSAAPVVVPPSPDHLIPPENQLKKLENGVDSPVTTSGPPIDHMETAGDVEMTDNLREEAAPTAPIIDATEGVTYGITTCTPPGNSMDDHQRLSSDIPPSTS